MDFKYDRVILIGENKGYIFKCPLDLYKWLFYTYKTTRNTTRGVRLCVKNFDLVRDYYMEKRAQYRIETLYVSSAKTRYYGLGLFHKNICLIDYAFKFGSDEVSVKEAFSSKYDSVWERVNSGFTGLAKKKIHIDLVEEEFKPIFKDLRSILLHYSVKGPTIGCRPNYNYTNVSAWDVKSAYPYWVYTAEFPYTFI